MSPHGGRLGAGRTWRAVALAAALLGGVVPGPSAGQADSPAARPTASPASPPADVAQPQEAPVGGGLVPLPPARVLDSRVRNGAVGPINPDATVHLQVAGRGGVPTSGVSAVVLNVTVTRPQTAGFVTAYADGRALPSASNVNFTAGATVANLVVAQVGANGRVSLRNSSAGTVELVADVSGYFTAGAAATPGAFTALPPSRVLDSRARVGAVGPINPGATVHLPVAGRGGVPASGVSAVVLNVTVAQARAPGYVTVYPDGLPLPRASNLNFTTGRTVAGLVVVPVGANGRVALTSTAGGTVELIGDVAGWFRSGAPSAAGAFAPLPPTRMLDTRSGIGIAGTVAPQGTLHLQVASRGSVPASGASAVVLTVTVTRSTAAGFVTVYPDGRPRPGVSSVNFTAGATVPNLVVVLVGANGRVALTNSSSGTVELVADVAGYALARPPTTAVSVSAGSGSACAVTDLGGVECWGRGRSGELGNGSFGDSASPYQVAGLTSGVAEVGVGDGHACALTRGGAVLCWGDNTFGELGDGTATTSAVPVQVSGLASGVSALAVGGHNACAVLGTGAVRCWGLGDFGGNGNGSNLSFAVPTPVSGLTSGAGSAAVGGQTACAVRGSGSASCWGAGAAGQLGNGSTAPSTVPTAVSGLGSDVRALAVGAVHACALDGAGALACWGANASGQLGTGTTAPSSAPVPVGGVTATAVTAGAAHTCALTAGAALACWGAGTAGQLGTGATSSSTRPVAVPGLSGVAGVSAGGAFTCAVTTSRAAFCWGANDTGQLGDRTLSRRSVPAPVRGL